MFLGRWRCDWLALYVPCSSVSRSLVAVSAGTFQKTSLNWQIQQLQQRIEEGLERLLFRNNQDSFDFPDWQIPGWLQQVLFWVIVISTLAWAGWQVYKLLGPYWSLSLDSTQTLSSPPSSSRSTEPTIAEWLKRSRTAQHQGNYREACRALYMAMLLHLSDRHLISQDLSRTDGEYLNLVQSLPQASPYHILIQTHEQLCFSNVSVSAEMFDRCWQAYREIEAAGAESRE